MSDDADQIVVFGPYGRRLTRQQNDAIGVVARHVAAYLIEQEVGEAWESFPEIGEDDWQDVVDRVGRMVRFPDRDAYAAAYALLQSRAQGNV
jgi:hypothetical protein